MLKKQILVIEDDPIYLKLMTSKLLSAGHFVVGAATAREGLRQLSENNIDLVICDASLPDISGFSLKKQVKETFHVSDFILISAYPVHEMVIDDMDLVLNENFFLKPVDFEQLSAKIEIAA